MQSRDPSQGYETLTSTQPRPTHSEGQEEGWLGTRTDLSRATLRRVTLQLGLSLGTSRSFRGGSGWDALQPSSQPGCRHEAQPRSPRFCSEPQAPTTPRHSGPLCPPPALQINFTSTYVFLIF